MSKNIIITDLIKEYEKQLHTTDVIAYKPIM